MKQKIVLFDIDYTLFDTSYFHSHFHKKLATLFAMDEEEIKEISTKIIVDLVEKESYLDIEKYIQKLLTTVHKTQDKEKIEEILFRSLFFKDGFYQEVGKTLEALKSKATIGIFSQGDPRFQWAKIEQSGFKEFFHKDMTYLIKPTKLDYLPELKKRHTQDTVYLVDDKPSVLVAVKDFMPEITTIWIKRGKYAKEGQTMSDFHPDYTIENLEKVVSIIDG